VFGRLFHNNPNATKNNNNLTIKNYEKDFTFIRVVAIGDELCNAKILTPDLSPNGEESRTTAHVLYRQ
jgi:hypothetical protein